MKDCVLGKKEFLENTVNEKDENPNKKFNLLTNIKIIK
jgi:hypothetical protein